MKAELTVIASVKSINSSKLERQNYQQEMKQRNALYVCFCISEIKVQYCISETRANQQKRISYS